MSQTSKDFDGSWLILVDFVDLGFLDFGGFGWILIDFQWILVDFGWSLVESDGFWVHIGGSLDFLWIFIGFFDLFYGVLRLWWIFG